MKRAKPTATQLRAEYFARITKEPTPELVRMTGHACEVVNPIYTMQLFANKPVESHLVYDKPDLKKLRRLLKSQTRSARSPHRETRSRPS